ncbi:MAG: winged helix-turn-helix transcriptional regulator [Saccharofermentans sp.]|nr:winged helix-turn-helix transcriptional regulator [Saccharofermentans sp.]
MVRKISKNYSNSELSRSGSYPVFYAIGLTGHRLKISVLLLIDELNQIDFDGLLSRLGGVSRFVLIKMLRDLESDCVITRTTSGNKAGYSLTLTGKQIIPILNSMND